MEIQARAKLWKQFDYNGNGLLSVSEAHTGLRSILSDKELAQAKLAILNAFNNTKSFSPSKNKKGKDFIEKNEFRIFLVALR